MGTHTKRSYPLPLYLHAHSGAGGGSGGGSLTPRVALAHDDDDGASGQARRTKLFLRPNSGAQTERLLRSGATTPLSLEQPALRGFVRLDLDLGGTERRVIERDPAAADMARDAAPLSPGVVHRARPAAPEQPYIFLKTSASVASRPTERQSLWADRTAGLPPPSFAMGTWPEEGDAAAEEAKEAGAATSRRKLAATLRPSTSPHGAAHASAAAAATAALIPAVPLARGQPMGPPYLPPATVLEPVLREGAHGGSVALAAREAPQPPYRPGASRREARAEPSRDSGDDSGTAVAVSATLVEEKESVAAGGDEPAPEPSRSRAQQQRRRRADASVPPSTAPAGTIIIPRRSHTAAASSSAATSASPFAAAAVAAAVGPAPSRPGRSASPPRPYTTVPGLVAEDEHVVDHFPSAPSARRAHRDGLGMAPRDGASAAAAGSVSARAAVPALPAPSLTPRGAGPAASGSSTARTAITIRARSRPGNVAAAATSATAAPSPSPAAMAARIQQAVILLASRPATTTRVTSANPDQGQEEESKNDAAAVQTHLVPYARGGNRSAVEAALRRQQRRKGKNRDFAGDDFDGSAEESEYADTIRGMGHTDDVGDGDESEADDEGADVELELEMELDPAAMLRAIDPATLGADHAGLHAHLALPGSILGGLVAAQRQGQAQPQPSSSSASASPNLAPNLAVVEAWLTEMAIKYQRKIEGSAGGEAAGSVSAASRSGGGGGVAMDTAGAAYQSPLDRLSLGRRVLLKAGLDATLAPRVLVGLYTYTLGALAELQRRARHVSQRKQLVRMLWGAYLANLERSEPDLYAWVARCVAAENARRESLRREEHLVRSRALRAHIASLGRAVSTLSSQDATLAALASDEARSMGRLGVRLRDMQHDYEIGVERRSTIQTDIADWTIKYEAHHAHCSCAAHGGSS